MFGVNSDSVVPKVLHVLCHCYAAINIFIKIFNVLFTFSYRHVYLDHAFRGVTNIFVDLNRDEDIHAVFRLPANFSI